MMTTSFLDFNKNEEEDITNTPEHYHKFEGAGLRIRCYWTSPILRDSGLLASSFNTIRTADEILRKYTLKLDLLPPLAQMTTAMRAKIHANADSHIPKQVRPLMIPSVRKVTDAVIDTVIDQNIDRSVATGGALNFDEAIPVPYENHAPFEPLQKLHQFIEPVREENRLNVVFVPLNGPANGYTALEAQWLPWVLVDPRDYDDRTVLLHEIGHACRLAHQQNDGIATMDGNAKSRNLMSYLNQHDWLWGWQVDTLYDSYWCAGARPNNWWSRDNGLLPGGHPFLWDN